MKHLTKLRDYLHRNPMWKTCNIDLYQNGFQMYFGPEDKDIISKSYTDYINGKGDKYTEEDRKRCFTDLNFVLEDFPFQCRGLCVWQSKKYKPGRTHFIFIFTDRIPMDKELFGTAIHELQHVVDYIFIQHKLERSMGPGPSEVSAYIMQYLMRRMFAWFENLLLNVIPNEVVTDEDKGVIKAGDEQAVVASPHAIEVYGQTKTFVTEENLPDEFFDHMERNWTKPSCHRLAIALKNSGGVEGLLAGVNNCDISPWILQLDDPGASIQNIIDHEGDNVRLVTDRFRAGEYDIFKIENAPFGHKLQQDVVPIDMLNIDNGVVHKVRLIQDWRTTDKYNAVCFSDQAWVLTTTVIFNVKLHKEINGKKRFFPHIESIISGDLYCGTSILEKDGCAPSLANKAKGEGISVLEAKHIGIDLVWIRPTTDLRNALRDRLYKKDFSKSMLDRWNAANLRQRLHMAIDTQPLGLMGLYRDKTTVSRWLEDAQIDPGDLQDLLMFSRDKAFKKIDLVESDRFTAYEFTVPEGIVLQRDVVGITELADDDMIKLSFLRCSDKVRWVCCMKETPTHLTTNKITFVIDKWTDKNKTVFQPHIVKIQCGDYIQATHVDEDVINHDDRYKKLADTPMPVVWVRESTLLPDETYVLIEKCKMIPNGGIERSS